MVILKMEASQHDTSLSSNNHSLQQHPYSSLEQDQMTQQHLSYLQTPFELTLPSSDSSRSQLSAAPQQAQQSQHVSQQDQQQQPPPPPQSAIASLSTPEALWSEYCSRGRDASLSSEAMDGGRKRASGLSVERAFLSPSMVEWDCLKRAGIYQGKI
jgi:hypothetical protein